MKLTTKAATAATLPPGKSDHIIWDTELPRFGLRIRIGAGGKTLRTWIAQYSIANKARRISFGSPPLVSAETARAEARKLLAARDLGGDPARERRKDKHTLLSVIERYLEHKRVKPHTLRDL